MDLTALTVGLASPAAEQSKTTGKNVGSALDHNAKSQAVNLRGTPDESPKSSLFFNPGKTQETEKWDILQAFLLRGRAAMSLLTTTVLQNTVVTDFVPKLIANTTLASVGPMALKAKDILASAGLAAGELGAARILLKDMIANGFEIKRLAEPFGVVAKAIFNKGETVIHNEAPVVVTTGSIINNNAVVISDVADLRVSMVREEITRIANVYGLEAGYLTALIQATALIKAGEVEIDALGTISLNATAGINLKSAGPIKIESLSTVDIKGSAVKIEGLTGVDVGTPGAISMQAGAAVNIHGIASATMSSTGVAAVSGLVGCMPWGMIPVPPTRADLLVSSAVPVVPPVPVVPTLPPVPSSDIREAEMIEQTQGMTTIGGTVL